MRLKCGKMKYDKYRILGTESAGINFGGCPRKKGISDFALNLLMLVLLALADGES